jgi:hypothetical protein
VDRTPEHAPLLPPPHPSPPPPPHSSPSDRRWEFGWLPDERVVTVASLPPAWPTTGAGQGLGNGTMAAAAPPTSPPATWLSAAGATYRGASPRQPAHAGTAATLERARLTSSGDVWALTPGAVRAVGVTVNHTQFAPTPPGEGESNEGSVELAPAGGGMTLYGPVAADTATLALGAVDFGNLTRSDAFLSFRALSASTEQPETLWRMVYATVLGRAASPPALSPQAQRGVFLYDTAANLAHVGNNMLVGAAAAAAVVVVGLWMHRHPARVTPACPRAG